MKTCCYCKITKSLDAFGPHSRRGDGKQTYCKACAKEKQAEWYYSRKFGITLQERDALLIKQNNKCAICETQIEFDVKKRGDNIGYSAVVDHCHNTRQIRGILCGFCNTGLGSFKDELYNLAAAFDYLQKSGKK